MFAIILLRKRELHREPFAVSSDKEILSSASRQKQQQTLSIRTNF